jgi:hypothetical protein
MCLIKRKVLNIPTLVAFKAKQDYVKKEKKVNDIFWLRSSASSTWRRDEIA